MTTTLKSGTRGAGGNATPTTRPFKYADRHDVAIMLTDRQKEVLDLVAKGHTNREIARRLNKKSDGSPISVRTVEVHRFNLMRRLRVRNVAQLIRQGMLLRLIKKQAVPNR